DRLHDLREGPVGDAVAVGNRAALQAAESLGGLRDLAHETRLADSGGADERDEIGPAPRSHVEQPGSEQVELALPAHQRDLPGGRATRADRSLGAERL